MKSIGKINLVFLLLLILFVSGYQVKAQENIKEKLSSIKGDVSRITITADGKDTIFEGDEAVKLFDRITKKDIKLEFISDDDADITWLMDEGCEDVNGAFKKEIKVDIVEGVKKVTIRTIEDGKEKTEILEGKEAENFLDKIKAKDNEQLILNLKKDKKRKCIILNPDDEKIMVKDSLECIKIIMDGDNDVKKIKINKKGKNN